MPHYAGADSYSDLALKRCALALAFFAGLQRLTVLLPSRSSSIAVFLAGEPRPGQCQCGQSYLLEQCLKPVDLPGMGCTFPVTE